MYGKIFDSMYDGTLSEDWRALITFQQMIVLCDADGVVDMTPSAISRRTGIPIEHIKAGIEILEGPDQYSRTEGEDGCRIKPLDDHRPWGWYLVNHSKYKAMQDSGTVRAQNRERKRRQRDKDKKSRPVTDGHAPSRHTDTDTDTYKDKTFVCFWDLYPRKENKKKAKTAFDNLSLTDQQAIIEHLPIRIEKQWQHTAKQFIPQATTFLNGRRWEDEFQAVAEEQQATNIREMSDRQLMNMAKEKNLGTHGLDRESLIRKLEKSS